VKKSPDTERMAGSNCIGNWDLWQQLERIENLL